MRARTRLVLSSLLASPSAAQLAREGLRNLRRLCLLLALALMWSVAVAPVALAATAPPPAPLPSLFAPPSPQQVGKDMAEAARARDRQAEVRQAMQQALDRSDAALARAAAHSRPHAPSVTLLDMNGRLTRPLDPYQAGQWERELKTPGLAARRAATLHVWLGEWELGAEQQPGRARQHFAQAEALVPPTDDLHGLAAYDAAISLYIGGAYTEATSAFHRLLLPATALPGYSRPLCALWWRHAAACDGYHQDHARLGIPEPPRLDPYCGAAAVAASLRALRLPYGKTRLVAACRPTGEGNDLADLVAAGPALGVHVRSLTATDQGLMALPKPVIAYVEHDHFISVVRADKNGVAYLCSDCGPWPGGEVDLTWRQWHALDPGVYAAVVRPGSRWDLALDAIDPASGVRLASRVGAAHGLTPGRRLASLLPALPALRGVSLRQIPTTYYECAPKDASLVHACFIHSPELSSPSGSSSSDDGGARSLAASAGDPVNLSTGEEVYAPDADLTVYNPHGPSVTWRQNYDSLDGDFGGGWTETYDVGIVNSETYRAVFMADGSSFTFTAPTAAPTAGHPLQCQVQAGAPFLVQSNYGTSGDYYSVVFPDRTQWVMQPGNGYLVRLTKIVDRNGNAITFQYNSDSGLLSAIADASGNALLTITRGSLYGPPTSISDCYGRSVYYQESDNELTGVSQVVPTGTTNAVTEYPRYVYGYENLPYPGNDGEAPYLNTITVPSPSSTGPATSQATISYNSQTELVTGLEDGNGNTAAITYLSGTSTQVKVSGPHMPTPYSYTVGYNNQMSQTSRTDGAGHAVDTIGSFAPNDPYEPSAETDGNGRTTSYTWDQYGNMLTETPPTVSGERTPATTVNTYSYPTDSNGNPISTGELTQTQTGSKTATSYAYYEPSGLVGTVTGPQPGTAGQPAEVLAAYTYDALGNVTSVKAPGPASTPAATTSSSGFSTYVGTYLYYTSDSAYATTDGTQYPARSGVPDALGEPLAVADPLGHVTHFRYAEAVPYEPTAGTPINRGHATSMTDAGNSTQAGAAGDETQYAFNIDGRPLSTAYPKTGQSGSGHGSSVSQYLYDEGGDSGGYEQYGPVASQKTYDEGNTAGPFRTVGYAYGPEGELLGVSGGTEPVTYAYDALYRLTSLTDGNGSSGTTRYFYNTAGYLYQTAYPLSGATTAPLSAGSADTVTYTGYDGAGDVTARVDGNGTTTAYTYADPESLLTNVHYTLPSNPPSYISALADTNYTYDAYGRRQGMTDATGSQSYTYDDGDRALTHVTAYTGRPAQTLTYGYDPDGSRATMALTGIGTYSYAYDAAGRMTGETNPYGERSSWAYLSNDWLQTQTDGYGLATTKTYDARGQVTDLNTKNSGGAGLADFSMAAPGGYDGAGNRLRMAQTVPATAYTGAISGTVTDGYDGRDELVSEVSTLSSASYTNTDRYDGVSGGTTTGPGNPTTLRGASHTFNADNQLSGTGYAYDGDGNPITYNGTACQYDPEGRLTSYGSGSTWSWDGDGHWGNAGLIYDGDTPVAVLGGGGYTNALTWGPDGLLSDHTSGGNSLYDLYDPSGDAAQRWGSQGSIGQSSALDGFGRRFDATGGDFYDGYQAQWGGWWNLSTSGDGGSTGLVLLGHRLYDTLGGRFLTRDPIGYDGGVDLYAYTANDPVNRSDPSGYGWVDSLCARFPWLCFWRKPPPVPTPQPTPTQPSPTRPPIGGQPVDPPSPVNEGPFPGGGWPPGIYKGPLRPIGGPGSAGDPGSGGRLNPPPPTVEPPYELPPDEPPMGIGPGEILGPIGIVGTIIDCLVHPEDCGARRVPLCYTGL